MPTYEFRCPDGHEFEKFYRTISGAESQATCPVCGKVAERFMSVSGFALKGTGFYLTDYGKNAHRTSGPEPKPTEGKSSEGAKESSSGGTAEAKPAPASGSSASSESKSSSPSETKPAAKPEKPDKPSKGE